MNKDNKIDKVFREKSQEYTKLPPEEVWDSILSEIQAQKKKPILIFWKIAAGFAIIIGLGTGYLLQTQKTETKKQAINLLDDSFSKKEITPKATDQSTEISNQNNKKPIIEKLFAKSINNNKEKGNIITASTNEKTKTAEHTEKIKNKNRPLLSLFIPQQLPLQVKGTPIRKDIIPEKNYINQYSWDDLTFTDEKIKDKKNDKKMSIAALMSPVYSYRDISSGSNSDYSSYNDIEKGKINYSGGMEIGYIAGKRLSIHTGIIYSRMTYNIQGISSFARTKSLEYSTADSYSPAQSQPFLISNSIGYISNNDLNSDKLNTSNSVSAADPEASINYLLNGGLSNPINKSQVTGLSLDQIFDVMEVPFLLKYKIIDKKIDFNILGGLSTNFIIGNKVLLKDGKQTENLGKTESINNINYAGKLGLGLEYDLKENLLFHIEPQFKYYLNSINKQNLIVNKPYSFGFYTGVSYIF